MAGNIFYLDEQGNAISLKEQKYESEDLFQRLIEQHPDILAGDQIAGDEPRKWLLVAREMGVPNRDGGEAQWFLDHLFLDQDAIPTFVEVKRSTDTRIRREVVAQMLDYAANASAYWPVAQIRAMYEERCQMCHREPLDELGLSPAEAEDYWSKVHTNLRAGKLRLLFVADAIPESLRRIIEFLNGQMADTEVLGLEIRQYLSAAGQRILVPEIVGKTLAAEQAKTPGDVVWTEETFLERTRQNSGEQDANICKRLLQAFSDLGCRIWWGRGQKYAGFVPIYDGKQKHQFCSVYSYNGRAAIEIYFQYFKAPFDREEKQRELLTRFNGIKGVSIPESKLFKRPSFDCGLLAETDAFDSFMRIYEEILHEIRDSEKQQ